MSHENTVLIVEDHPDILFATSHLLQHAGYSVLEATSGEKAIQLAQEQLPNLILLDYVLPDIDGLEVLRTLKSDSATSHIYICIVSGARTSSEDQVDGFESGADEYLVRPIANRELLSRVTAMLRVQNAEQALREHRDNLNELVHQRTLELQREVAEHKRTMEAHAQSESKWRGILSDAPLIGLTIQASGELTFVNNYFLRITGWSKDEVIGKNWFDLAMPENVRRDVLKIFSTVLRRGDVTGYSHYENDILTKSGKLLRVAWSNVVTKDQHGKIQDITCLGLDLTDRIRVEEELRHFQKMEAIGTLAGGIAHEFNNMLSIILGNAELATEEIATGHQAQECLDEIKVASLRAKEVVEKLVTVSTTGAPKRKLIQIGRAVEDSIDLLTKTLPASIAIHSNIFCSSETIHGTLSEISQLLIHICNNSVQSMARGTGTLKIELTPEDGKQAGIRSFPKLFACPQNKKIISKPPRFSQGGAENTQHSPDLQKTKHVALSISDDGAGIAPEIIDRVFDPYFTTKDVDKGLGMGLSLVRSIVDKYDGILNLESTPGKGTRVEIFFPLVENNVQQDEDSGEKSLSGNIGVKHILVVDDEEAIVKLNKRSLERHGYRVTGFTDPKRALKHVKEDFKSIDLVITDMTMPHMTGVEFSKEVKTIKPEVPVILCTGYSDLIDEKTATGIGVDSFLTKPVVTRDLLEQVNRLLQR